MLDYFFSLDQLLADEFVKALDHSFDTYALQIYAHRCYLADENNA